MFNKISIRISLFRYILFFRYLLLFLLFTIVQHAYSQNPVIEFFDSPEPFKKMNTADDENYLIQRSDDQSMIFSRMKSPMNIGGSKNPADLWFFSLADSVAVALNIDPSDFNTPIGFSPLTGKFYYNSVRFEKGLHSGSILSAVLINGTLDNLEEVQLNYFKNKSSIQSGCMSYEGRYIIISAEGTSTYGVEDLYVMNYQSDGSWSSPRNLGSKINSPFQELTPFLAQDNRTLFFATNGRKDGMGSFDLYYSVRMDDTWQSWTEPVNLGKSVNTPGSETSFTFLPESDFAYFVSTTNSDGYGDIKRIKIKSEIEPNEVFNVQEVTPKLKSTEPDYMLIFVKDESNGKWLPAKLSIVTELEALTLGAPFKFKKGEMIDLSITASHEGFLTKSMTLTSQQINLLDTLELLLTPLKVGTVVTLDNVLFHRGTANLIDGSEVELEKVVQMMKDYPKLKILLKGHTDSHGDPKLNLDLSQERVRKVNDYLIKQGIEFNRITGKGYGGNSPLVSNDTDENRQKNRRVEFEIVEN